MSDRISPANRARAALKAAGFTARQVTVRADACYSLSVTIRDATVRKSVVDAVIGAVVPAREHYGDGQPFMSPGHRTEYLSAIVEPIADVIEAALLTAGPGVSVDTGVGRASWHADRGREPYNASVFVNGSSYCMGVRHAANRLAVETLDREPPDAWLDRLDLDESPARPVLRLVPAEVTP